MMIPIFSIECARPLGLENYRIADSAIASSSEVSLLQIPQREFQSVLVFTCILSLSLIILF